MELRKQLNKIGAGHDTVFAYIYREDERYSPKIEIEIDPRQIASFLVRTKNSYYVMITNWEDLPEMSTIPDTNGFLDRCSDQEFLQNELLDILIPMQQGEIYPDEVRIKSIGISDEDLSSIGGIEGFKKWTNDTFKVSL